MQILFFDTETNTILEDINTSETEVTLIPRLSQLAWIVDDENGRTIVNRNYLVEGQKIKNTQQKDVEKLHLLDILTKFIDDLMSVDIVVAHNYKYDSKIVGAEFIRNNLTNPLRDIESYCSMESTVQFCNLKNENGLKFPTLPQLYFKTTGIPLKNAHEAYSDALMLKEAYWGLFIKGEVNLHSYNEEIKYFKMISLLVPKFISVYRLRLVERILQKEIDDTNEEIDALNKKKQTKSIKNRKSDLSIYRDSVNILINFDDILTKNHSKPVQFINDFIFSQKASNDEFHDFVATTALSTVNKDKGFPKKIEKNIKNIEDYFLNKSIGVDINKIQTEIIEKNQGISFSEFKKNLFKEVQPFILEIESVHRWNQYLDNRYFFFNFIAFNNKYLAKNEGCYIATLCYGNAFADEVLVFKEYRDSTLKKYILGKIFIRFYYKISPSIVSYLKDYPQINKQIKNLILDPIHFLIK